MMLDLQTNNITNDKKKYIYNLMNANILFCLKIPTITKKIIYNYYHPKVTIISLVIRDCSLF